MSEEPLEMFDDVGLFDIVLSEDLKNAASELGPDGLRYMVKSYYDQQRMRIASDNRQKKFVISGEPRELPFWFVQQQKKFEKTILATATIVVKKHVMGNWLMAQFAVGPVTAAALITYLDIHRAPSVSHFWSLAGWAGDHQKKWEKKQKRPWNPTLRTALRQMAECFKRNSGRDGCYYGKLYLQRKAYETAKNENGDYAAQAAVRVMQVNKGTDAYKAYAVGKLPPAHIDARALRWTAKIFLAHFHAEWFRRTYGKEAPHPHALVHLGHVHEIPPAPLAA